MKKELICTSENSYRGDGLLNSMKNMKEKLGKALCSSAAAKGALSFCTAMTGERISAPLLLRLVNAAAAVCTAAAMGTAGTAALLLSTAWSLAASVDLLRHLEGGSRREGGELRWPRSRGGR